jgi:hypothetical protein
VVWFPPPTNLDVAGILAVDRWLDAIAKDTRPGSKAAKVIRNRPADVRDTCWIDGEPVADPATCRAKFPGPRYGGTPRVVAGGPLTSDVRKCHLRPLRRADYPVAFTQEEWSRLAAVFPDGVCDWSRPSVGYQRSVPWLAFDRVGGRPLGAAPVSVPFGPAPAAHAGAPNLPATGWGLTPLAALAVLAAAGLRRAAA